MSPCRPLLPCWSWASGIRSPPASHHSHHAETRRSTDRSLSEKTAEETCAARIPSLLLRGADCGSLHTISPASFASMRARIFRGEDRHGARRYRRRNSPPIRDTSYRVTQTPPQAARSCRELPQDPVYAAEAVGGREDQPGRHGVSSTARAG